MSYGKFRIGVISKAEYDSEGVGYSTVAEDFPMEIGPLAPYDTLSGLMKPWGRHPDTGEPLYVTEVDRYTGTITQEGVNSTSAFATPTVDTVPAACIVVCQVTAASVISAIDAANKHFVLGIDNPDLSGDPLPPALEPYDWDVAFPPARWTQLRNSLVALGLDAEIIDDWHDANPDATPREFGEAFKRFIK